MPRYFDVRLPEPLPNEELKYYIKKAQAGNVWAREKAIVHNIRLVIDIVEKYYSKTYHEYEDLVSIGVIGLIKAIDTYDVDRGVKFASYAVPCIRNEIGMALRGDKHRKKVTNFTDLMGQINNRIKNPDVNTVDDILVDDDDFVEQVLNEEEYEVIREAIEFLNEHDREIVKLYYGFYGRPMSQREVSQICKTSRSNICKILKRSRNVIQKYVRQREQGKILVKNLMIKIINRAINICFFLISLL